MACELTFDRRVPKRLGPSSAWDELPVGRSDAAKLPYALDVAPSIPRGRRCRSRRRDLLAPFTGPTPLSLDPCGGRPRDPAKSTSRRCFCDLDDRSLELSGHLVMGGIDIDVVEELAVVVPVVVLPGCRGRR